jgi:hypothetical protein
LSMRRADIDMVDDRYSLVRLVRSVYI